MQPNMEEDQKPIQTPEESPEAREARLRWQHDLKRISLGCISIICLALAAGIVLWLVISLTLGIEVCNIEGRRATVAPKYSAFAGTIPFLAATAVTCAFDANSYFDGKKRIWWPSLREGSRRPSVLRLLAVGLPFAAMCLSIGLTMVGIYKTNECADDSEFYTALFGFLLINLFPTVGMLAPQI